MWYPENTLLGILPVMSTTLKIIVVLLILLKLFQVLTVGRCKSMKCLVGKTAIVTGGSSGMGFETALVLASRGCRVIIADRNPSQKPKEEIIAKTNNSNVEMKYIDLASLESVRKFAEEINETESRLDILINNAGVGAVGNKYTKDGLHSTMQINHFGPFLLTHLLVDLLKKSAPSRVIFVSSMLAFTANLGKHNLNYRENHSLSFLEICNVYANSKLCNVISSNGFAERLKPHGISVNSLHPGAVNTNIYRTFVMPKTNKCQALVKSLYEAIFPFLSKTPEEGVQTALYLALSDDVQEVTGKHFWDCRVFAMPPKAANKTFCQQIWEESERLVHLRRKEAI